ncbi:histidinol-phosphate transaminase [Bacillus toyonensis]|uniref:pyridoxal phosphate-dependent aminotransferase n=1 Tax=Bacillus toyonensis TaxID=155322 RepID=UPI003D215D66
MIHMNLNENPFVNQKYYRYPDASYTEIRKLLYKRFAITQAEVLIGNGSTEIISAIFLWAHLHKKKIIYPWPSYILYDELAQLYDVEVIRIPMGVASWDINVILSFVPENSLLILCNPNNPTGTFLKKASVKELISRLPVTTTLLLDEAYIEYVEDSETNGLAYDIDNYQNLIVVRTFSKYYGLAGLRIGYALLSQPLYNIFRSFMPLWNVSTPAVEAAIKCLSEDSYYKKGKITMTKYRDMLCKLLCATGFYVLPSQTNFLCFTHPNINDYVEHWANNGFVVNKLLPYQNSELHGYVRLSIEKIDVLRELYQLIKEVR